MKVYIVVRDFYSHDMFVSDSAKAGDPKVYRVFAKWADAKKELRSGSDDYIVTRTVR